MSSTGPSTAPPISTVEMDGDDDVKRSKRPGFFRVGKKYLIKGHVFEIHAVVESIYGPVAFASFERGGGLDVQMLIVPQYAESELIK